jgi:hypothetical protein
MWFVPRYLPLLLGLPALLPLVFACCSAWSHGLLPTGFVSSDLPCYMANARAHFAGGFHLTYGNPYAPYGTPAVYFQPQGLLLALLVRAGLDPGVAFNLFGLGAIAFAATAAARLYEKLVGWQTLAQKLGLVCLFWGGGVLSMLGLACGPIAGVGPVRASLLFDFNEGWWMLNFGRNLVYPTEAFYHGIFLLTILMLVQRRFAPVLALTALLSMSHPFTGLTLALVVAAYAALELAMRSGAASWKLLAGAVIIAALHVAYYLVFLDRFADHRAVHAQLQINWPYPPWIFIPALFLVGFAALTRLIYSGENQKHVLEEPRARLFLVWFAVVLGLTQHDLVVKPTQPIHFAHGYDWLALFFLAAPALLSLLDRLLAIERPLLRVGAMTALFIVILFDNLMWFVSFGDPAVQHYAISLDRDQRAVLDWVERHAAPPAIVVSEDFRINYLTSTYTGVKAWSGSVLNTPHAAERAMEVDAVFNSGKFIATANPIYYIPRRERNWIPPDGSRRVFGNAEFTVWYWSPQAAEAPLAGVGRAGSLQQSPGAPREYIPALARLR